MPLRRAALQAQIPSRASQTNATRIQSASPRPRSTPHLKNDSAIIPQVDACPWASIPTMAAHDSSAAKRARTPQRGPQTPRFIVIEGPLRVGKTTLAKILAERLHARRIYDCE